MRRLLWKEFRERRWWALAWALVILGISLFGHGQSFYGERAILTSPLQALPCVIGLLVGAGAYAGELARSQSVFSRPIDWRILLGSKLLFAAAICLGAALLATVNTWIVEPAPYRHLATPSNMLLGALGVVWLYWLFYLLGLTCSTVISGLAGGILTLVAAFLPLIAAMALLEAYIPGWYGSSPSSIANNLHLYAGRGGWFVGAWLGITVAGLLMTRFALVLSNDERIKRFTLIYLPIFLICGIAGLLLPPRLTARLFLHREVGSTYVSPQGQYALVTEVRRPFNFVYLPISNPGASFGSARYLVRMRDRQRLPVPTIDIEWEQWNWNWEWITDKIACVYVLSGERLYLIYPEKNAARVISLAGKIRRLHATSPDGRLLPVEVQCERQPFPEARVVESYRKVEVIDLQTGQILNEWKIGPKQYYLWWRDGDTLGYRSWDIYVQYWRIDRQ